MLSTTEMEMYSAGGGYFLEEDYFPTLIVRQKWHTSRGNLERGDLVLVQDTNMIRGKWKLAQVTEAEPGKDGKVRDVTVQNKNI